jgi:hypothetical protein
MARPAHKTYRLTQLVAERVLEFQGHDSSRRRVVVRLGLPRRAGPRRQDDWVCPFEIRGMLRDRRRWAFGIDAMQALTLAYHIIPAELDRLAREAGGGTFQFLGEPGYMLVDGCKLVLDHIAAGLAEQQSSSRKRRRAG